MVQLFSCIHLHVLFDSGYPGLDIGCGFCDGVHRRDPPYDTVNMDVRQTILAASEVLLPNEGAVQHFDVLCHLLFSGFVFMRALVLVIRANGKTTGFSFCGDSLQVNVDCFGGECNVGAGPHNPFHNFATRWTRRRVEA